jgi:hypothetical protein
MLLISIKSSARIISLNNEYAQINTYNKIESFDERITI